MKRTVSLWRDASFRFSMIRDFARLLPFDSFVLASSMSPSWSTWAWLDYNTFWVVLGCALLGGVCGLLGVFLLLRKRSLIADAICHASLPGIAIGFFVSLALGGSGRDPGWLIVGAAVTGTLGALSVMALRRWTPLKEDAALGIVLSVFFAFGMALLSLVQQTESGNAAGIEGFLYGNTAGIVAQDAFWIAILCGSVTLVLLLVRKELQLLCFDSSYAAAQGWPTLALDLLLMACTLWVVTMGTTIVGVLLIVAMIVIPPAVARLWSDRLPWNLLISAIVGVLSGILGALSSWSFENLPSGASMVLVAAALFAVSLLFASRRGVLWQWTEQWRMQRQIQEEHVLRGMFEWLEKEQSAPALHGSVRSEPVAKERIASSLGWDQRQLNQVLKRLIRLGWVHDRGDQSITLTVAGIQQSHRAVRRHRLLELYFSHWADLNSDAIDRCADYTEHALDDELLARLERDAMEFGKPVDLPPSIHPVG